MALNFKIIARDSVTNARVGQLETTHGTVETPVFIPVGTTATVKMLTPQDLKGAGVQLVLGNTYHLMHHPGADLVEKAGGLALFMSWNGPTITDSGGFQVFSLAATRKVTDAGVVFKSVYDGRSITLTPESVYKIQVQLGADIIYALDECPPYPASYEEVNRAVTLTEKWAVRFLNAWKTSKREEKGTPDPFLIVQGGVYSDLRRLSAELTTALDPPGFGIGGVSVGEPREDMIRAAAEVCEILPESKPRHLMGVGTPIDLLESISVGIDMFDCVLPTRNGRNGQAFTSLGTLNLRNSTYRGEDENLDPGCICYCCRTFSRGYLHHLMSAGELLGARMLSLHNVHYYQELMKQARQAVIEGNFSRWKQNTISTWLQES